MGGKRTRSFEDNIKEHIRRSVNNPTIKGTEKLKWCLAGIKLLQLEKITGSAEHGSGFADIDKDDEPDEELTEERGADDERDATGTGRESPAA